MMTQDQLAFAVVKHYSQLVPWKDYWTAHPVEEHSDTQTGEAAIVEWRADRPQPDWKTLKKTFHAHADEFNAQQARWERNIQLKLSDWTQMPDLAADTRTAWAAYRQALRDLPQQKNCPHQIVWPKIPTS